MCCLFVFPGNLFRAYRRRWCGNLGRSYQQQQRQHHYEVECSEPEAVDVADVLRLMQHGLGGERDTLRILCAEVKRGEIGVQRLAIRRDIAAQESPALLCAAREIGGEDGDAERGTNREDPK